MRTAIDKLTDKDRDHIMDLIGRAVKRIAYTSKIEKPCFVLVTFDSGTYGQCLEEFDRNEIVAALRTVANRLENGEEVPA